MPIGIAAGTAVIAGGASIYSSSKAAKAQKSAANKAADTSLQTTQMNNDLLRETRDKNVALASPYYNNGLLASNALTDLLLGTNLYNKGTVANPNIPGGGTFPTTGPGSGTESTGYNGPTFAQILAMPHRGSAYESAFNNFVNYYQAHPNENPGITSRGQIDALSGDSIKGSENALRSIFDTYQASPDKITAPITASVTQPAAPAAPAGALGTIATGEPTTSALAAPAGQMARPVSKQAVIPPPIMSSLTGEPPAGPPPGYDINGPITSPALPGGGYDISGRVMPTPTGVAPTGGGLAGRDIGTTDLAAPVGGPASQWWQRVSGQGGALGTLPGSVTTPAPVGTPAPGTPAPAPTGTPAPGADTTAPSALSAWDQFRNGTNYQWRFNEGQRALTSNWAVRGMGDSGAERIALQEQGQNFASNELSNYMNLLAGQQNVGLTAGNAVMGVSTSAANNIAAQNTSAGNAAANAALISGQANAQNWGNIGGAIGQAAGAIGGAFGGMPSGASTGGAGALGSFAPGAAPQYPMLGF